MREERLLERIARWENSGNRTNVTDVDLMVSSILRHLRGILNTSKGSVPIDTEYGIPDLTNLARSFTSTSASKIEQDLTRAIERYEPRLKIVSVRLVPDEKEPLSIKFEVMGAIRVDERDVSIRLSTVVTPEGKIRIHA